MRYLSVCSGIEAASVAWHALGWTPVAFAETDLFPRAVLAHHYPHVPNWGDMNAWRKWPDAAFDVLVGGTPCQSFSVAGLRGGMADPRGNLALVFLAILDRYRPQWVVWENVPGVLSSNGGRDFGAFLGGLGQLGYGWAYRVLDAQYVRVDGYPRAVPQRRRRVFVIGCARDWRRAAAVLFERESLQGHPAPRRKPRERIAPTISSRPTGGGGLGTDFDLDGGLLTVDVHDTLGVGANQTTGFKTEVVASTGDISHCLNAGGMGRIDYETETMIAHTLKADGFDASEDGTGRGTPLVAQPVSFDWQAGGGGNDQSFRGKSRAYIVDKPGATRALISNRTPAIAFDARQSDVIQYGDRTGPLDTDGSSIAVATAWAVRRLTPLEAERLQGFPDCYTAVPYRGKPAADGPRYKALGNSMAVNCMRWLGRRIEMVAAL